MLDAKTEKARRAAEMEQTHMTQEQADELARKMTSLGVK
jgi:hypothetical protein